MTIEARHYASGSTGAEPEMIRSTAAPAGADKAEFAEACRISKHSVVVAGHRTSISLETSFWLELKTAARERGATVASLVEEIDEQRSGNLSSAIRVWLFRRAMQQGG